ncbi:DUF397 domain-containing protein [Actinophytocola sp. NPDC049390]|uniref:DUF397 domain-containing protein n=1 Tax=Actinophytocola sp. NPDC049390 TaxID=3363894 RepID=UPI0037909261
MGERKSATVVEVDQAGFTWRKSSASASGNGGCVEFAQSSTAVLIRNSRNRHGTRIVVADSAWRLLVRTASRH